MILDSSSVNLNKEYYPQMFLEECKYAIKDKKNGIQLMKT